MYFNSLYTQHLLVSVGQPQKEDNVLKICILSRRDCVQYIN